MYLVLRSIYLWLAIAAETFALFFPMCIECALRCGQGRPLDSTRPYGCRHRIGGKNFFTQRSTG